MAKATAGMTKPARSRRAPKRPRVQLDFTPDAYDRIRELVGMSRVSSVPDMFRDALRVYEWYLVRKSEGKKLYLKEKGHDGLTAVDLGL